MYITFGYDGGGVQYASRISNRFVWTASNTVRLQYTLGLSAEVAYIQATEALDTASFALNNQNIYFNLTEAPDVAAFAINP